MPKRFTGKLCGFLFDHLERGTFGERLQWVDRKEGVFKILWKHGNSASATPNEDVSVFMEWHRYKTRRSECAPLDAKQRFRAALNKMKLDVVKSWEREKNFQFRKFPKEDLEYQFKKGDQRVPASATLSVDYTSETECQPTSPSDDASSSSAYSEPTSPYSFQNTEAEVAETQLESSAAKSPEISWQPLMAVRHSFTPPLCSEAPYRSLTTDEPAKFFEEIDNTYYSYNGVHDDVAMLTDDVLLENEKELLDDPFLQKLLTDNEALLSALSNSNDALPQS